MSISQFCFVVSGQQLYYGASEPLVKVVNMKWLNSVSLWTVESCWNGVAITMFGIYVCSHHCLFSPLVSFECCSKQKQKQKTLHTSCLGELSCFCTWSSCWNIILPVQDAMTQIWHVTNEISWKMLFSAVAGLQNPHPLITCQVLIITRMWPYIWDVLSMDRHTYLQQWFWRFFNSIFDHYFPT